jgi:type IV pilus assembly protein PilY1
VVRQGGKILKPVGTPGDEIKTYITNWGASSNNPQTWTNLAETLASAGQYFATVVEEGNRVGKGPEDFGHYEKNYHYDFGGSMYDATLTDDKGNTVDTTSPIRFYCEKAFVIFVTDGLANYDNDWDVVTDVIGNYDGDTESDDCKYGDAGCSGQGKYFDDVAKYLYENDMRSDLEETINITTYVIGFQIDDPLLSSAATQGGGQYFTASNADQLTTALQSAVKDILDKVAAGNAVATISTSAESDDHLVRAKFLPVSWKGFLEAYTLPFTDGDTPVWEAGDILSNTSSGNRHIYTYRGSEITKKQEFISSNSALKTYLSNEWSVTETEAADLINYIRGDPTNEGGKYRDRNGWPLGDIIHLTPVIVGAPKLFFQENDYQTFRQDNSGRTTMAYVGANDGMLHAFRAKDDPNADCGAGGADAGSELCGGSEHWAFIPEVLHADLKELSGTCHKYYVDLPLLATDIYDSINGAWNTVLIGGNRLGGEGYFSLDVTDPSHDNFSILWDTIPFSGFKSSTIPVVGKVKVKEGEAGEIDKWVAVITSGYHEGTTVGKIAALNFTDGAKEAIWNDGTSDVDQLLTQTKGGTNPYYTLSSPAAVDSDNDGYLDLIYTGDTEGTLWKFYFDYVDKIWKKVALFNTGGQPITAKPSLVFDAEGRLRIFFGTGKYLIGFDKYNTTRNAFYSLVEDVVDTEDANDGHFTGTTAISKADDLVNVTPHIQDGDFNSLQDSVKQQIMDEGWYFELDDPGVNPAERTVSEALVIGGVAFFTSFTPNSDVCGYGGDSRLYAVDFEIGVTSTSVFGEETPTERYIELGSGLPSKPVYYFSAATKKSTILVQTSDAQLHEEDVDLESRSMAITSWRTD